MVKEYAKTFDPEFFASEIAPPTLDTPLPESRDYTGSEKVILQAHDFGGSVAIPHYGSRQPAVDYFQSNLMVHNFVQSDLTTQKHTVMFYDEREQGKGSDACHSMRLAYQFRVLKQLRNKGIHPEKSMTLMILMDNCSGQNKSKSCFQFFSFLSLLYRTVVLFFNIRGHTKMVPDRVVGMWRASIKHVVNKL